MFVEDTSSWLASFSTVPGAHFYKAGDRVLVLIGDTLLPAVIEGACESAEAGETEWSVRHLGAERVYRLPESFLWLDMTSPT